jgi:group I intron endonuclease
MIVYVLDNKVNGKVYVGQTIHPLSIRWSQHKHNAFIRKLNYPLYTAIRKYGPDAFDVIEIGQAEDQNHLDEMEKAVIDIFNSMDRTKGYNLTAGGQGVRAKPSIETRLKMGRSRKGKKHSEETRKKMSLALLGNKRGTGNKGSRGWHWSEEDRKRMSEQRRGEKNGNFGRKHSEETKQKCREAALKQAQNRRVSVGEQHA